MKEQEYTKGEWRIEPLTTAIVDEERRLIATVSNYNTKITDEAAANCRIIKAAPRLYEALLAIKARIDGEWNNPHLLKTNLLRSKFVEDIQEIVETAIKKVDV